VDRQEGMSNSDSPTNLLWRLQNDFHARSTAKTVVEEPDDQPSFTEFTLDVKH
jgi:twitching motility protein PilU